jgi:1-acyl-sn-glycerol-3-phosphate acyltransferase
VFVSNHFNALIDPVLVMTDAACEISPIAKSTLWKVPGLAWLLDRAGAVPIVRKKDSPDKAAGANDETFAKIAKHLGHGGNILIFPEGTSHSEPQLAPLRTGAARMLLAAEQEGGVPPTFQAAALEFDERDTFRSRCLVLWGPVRAFADVEPGADDETRVRAATALMDADLRELLVEGDTHEDRARIARVAEMLANDEGDDRLSAWNDAGRKVEEATRTLRGIDPAVVSTVIGPLDAYYAELARLGVRDAQVVGGKSGAGKGTVKQLLKAPLAASGFALYALPYFIPRMVAKKSDTDAVSTIKLGAALVVYPVWMAGLVGASFAFLPPPLSLVAAAIAVTSPFAALRWLDGYYQRTYEPTTAELGRLIDLRHAAHDAIAEARARL